MEDTDEVSKKNVITKLIVLSSRHMMPGDLLYKIYALRKDVIVKETCFGAEVSGKKEDVNSLIRDIRILDPYGIFIKERGFPIGDLRRCRAASGGGARPGFHQIEVEAATLPLMSHALLEYDMGIKPTTYEKPAKLDVDVFKKIIADCLHSL
jgi:putative methanogenesis marker protein 6